MGYRYKHAIMTARPGAGGGAVISNFPTPKHETPPQEKQQHNQHNQHNQHATSLFSAADGPQHHVIMQRSLRPHLSHNARSYGPESHSFFVSPGRYPCGLQSPVKDTGKMRSHAAVAVVLSLLCGTSSSFTAPSSASRRTNLSVLQMGKGKGKLKQALEGDGNNPKSLNQGRGQEITGVTLPAEGMIKGWEFGNQQRMACAQVDGNFYAVEGGCPRCAFDLWKGTLVTDEAFGPDLPRVACPTCATTFSLRTGNHGPALKRTGLAGFVGGLAKTATVNEASKDAKAYIITRDAETGQVFCKER